MVLVLITAAMIRCVPFLRWYSSLFCQECGAQVEHVTESGDQLCGSCLAHRRAAFRTQRRTAFLEAARATARSARLQHDLFSLLLARRFPTVRASAVRALARERQHPEYALRNYEGDTPAIDLARNGYWDIRFEEFVGSESQGPPPRWIEHTHRTSQVRLSPNSLARAVFCLLAARMFPTIRANALRNAKIQLAEMWFVADGFRDLTTMDDGTDDRDMGPDVLSWLHRDPSTKQVLNRWNRPDDELEFMEQIRTGGGTVKLRDGSTREGEWWELMVDFRRRKLDALLKEYFGMDDYRAKSIVLKWETTSTGRFRPAHQMNVVDWVKLSCEESGSILGGLQSCTRSIQVKQQLRKRKESRNAVLAENESEDTSHSWA